MVNFYYNIANCQNRCHHATAAIQPLHIVQIIIVMVSLSSAHFQQDTLTSSFSQCFVEQPKEKKQDVEPIDKQFYSEEDGIIGYTICVPWFRDEFETESYFVHLHQTLPNEKPRLIVYPLSQLYLFTPVSIKMI